MKTLSDLTEPTKVVRELLEADVQKACVDWARARGYWARKFSSQSQRSVPDYLFSRQLLSPRDRIKFACEFKRPGTPKKTIIEHTDIRVMSTPAQVDEQAAMRVAGWFVFECDSFGKFKATVMAYEGEQCI